MSNQGLILTGAAVMGVAGAGIWYFTKPAGEKVYTLSNGVKGTAEELIRAGYMAISIGENLVWVSKEEYEKANADAGGEPNKLSIILDSAGAVLQIISTTIKNF